MKREPKTTSALPSMIGWSSTCQYCRVVLEVGVLDDDDLAGARGERRANGLALPPVLGLEDEPIDVSCLLELREELARAVGGAVVDDDDLLAHGTCRARDRG